MPRFAEYRVLAAVLALLAVPAPLLVAADSADGVSATSRQNVPYILVGFVGGFVRHTNPHHGPVQIAQRLRQYCPKDSHVEVFENRHRKAAYQTILRLLDSNHDGTLSNDEKARARIVLFGQSWGASAAVILARELNRIGVPVMLTVQVDSVAKPWQRDDVIPDNVAAAVNFYQTHGILHGRQLIRAADDSKTQILGNYRFDYKQSPVKCEGMPWFDRAFTPGHMGTECDPQLWGQVETLVRERLEPQVDHLAVIQKP
ncbi:MAG TPA: hypothetical protein VE377_09410 [Candidatus Dormibacteraeota bacterium]|nr:hypothetical protein [Candidatus Dormibacteraeota bacterium]